MFTSTRYFRIWVAVVACTSSCGLGVSFLCADDPPKPDVPVVDAAPYAPRKLKFRDAEDKLRIEIRNIEPKLLEQQYVATVRLDGPHAIGSEFGIATTSQLVTSVEGIKAMLAATPESLWPAKETLEMLQVPDAALPASSSSSRFGGQSRKPQFQPLHVRHVWKPEPELLQQLRELDMQSWGGGGGLNATKMKREITAKGLVGRDERGLSRGLARREVGGSGYVRSRHELSFLARTAGQAKALAEAFLLLYDQGYALPARRQAAQFKQDAQRKLAQAEADLKLANESLPEYKKQWETAKTTEDLNAESVSELKKKQLLLRVEQVGVTTRIAALDKKIAEFEKRRPGSVPDHILGLKESAEIDLAGLTGQLGEIERLVRTAAARREAENRYLLAGSRIQNLKTELELDKAELKVYEDDYLATAPYELADEAIPVQPIAWAAPAEGN